MCFSAKVRLGKKWEVSWYLFFWETNKISVALSSVFSVVNIETCKKIIALIEPVNGVEIEFKRNEEDNGYIINDDTDGVSDTFYELDREVVVDGDSIVVNGLCDRWVWDIIRQHSVGDYNDMIKKGTIKSTVEQVPVIEDED